jgi:hypothetical protein
MQFSRRYQQSGVCPNYADPRLVYGDEVETSPTAYAEPETTAAEPKIEVTPVEELPKIPAFKISKAWTATIEAHSVMIARMAAYGASLPEGHLESMFEQAASDLVNLWFAQGEASELISRFAAMIQSCSKETTMSESTKSKIIMETGTPCPSQQKARSSWKLGTARCWSVLETSKKLGSLFRQDFPASFTRKLQSRFLQEPRLGYPLTQLLADARSQSRPRES